MGEGLFVSEHGGETHKKRDINRVCHISSTFFLCEEDSIVFSLNGNLFLLLHCVLILCLFSSSLPNGVVVGCTVGNGFVEITVRV